jgi:hypothetical protein
MARIVTKIGDVFSVSLGDGTKKYIQYIANDLTQLNSDVIRGFRKAFPLDNHPTVGEVISDEVMFYSHTMVSLGVKMGLWEKVGRADEPVDVNSVLFRHTEQYARGINDPIITVSDKWYVWRIGKDFQNIGKLEGKYKNAFPGLVINPNGIIELLKGNKYPPLYPD